MQVVIIYVLAVSILICTTTFMHTTHPCSAANERSCKRWLCMYVQCTGDQLHSVAEQQLQTVCEEQCQAATVCLEGMRWRHSSLPPTVDCPPSLHASWTCRPALLLKDVWSAALRYNRVGIQQVGSARWRHGDHVSTAHQVNWGLKWYYV